jgi:hypothetical protein
MPAITRTQLHHPRHTNTSQSRVEVNIHFGPRVSTAVLNVVREQRVRFYSNILLYVQDQLGYMVDNTENTFGVKSDKDRT